MKHLVLGLFLLMGIAAWAQSSVPKELTYSRIIILDSAAVVPVGKVWKVESYASSYSMGFNSTDYFLLNNKQCNTSNNLLYYLWNCASCPSSTTTFSQVQFPLWIPSGSSISPRLDNGIYKGQLSIIEFDEK